MADETRPKKLRAPIRIIGALQAARQYALSEYTEFGNPNETVIYEGKKYTVDEFVKERIRLHHETWIVEKIDRALSWCRGEQL